MPDRLLRLNERPPDVMVADQSHLHRESGFFSESDRRTDARVRNWHDDVRVDRRLARENPPEIGADLVDAPAEDVAVRPGEIHVLEDTMRQGLRREWL